MREALECRQPALAGLGPEMPPFKTTAIAKGSFKGSETTHPKVVARENVRNRCEILTIAQRFCRHIRDTVTLQSLLPKRRCALRRAAGIPPFLKNHAF